MEKNHFLGSKSIKFCMLKLECGDEEEEEEEEQIHSAYVSRCRWWWCVFVNFIWLSKGEAWMCEWEANKNGVHAYIRRRQIHQSRNILDGLLMLIRLYFFITIFHEGDEKEENKTRMPAASSSSFAHFPLHSHCNRQQQQQGRWTANSTAKRKFFHRMTNFLRFFSLSLCVSASFPLFLYYVRPHQQLQSSLSFAHATVDGLLMDFAL